MLKEFSKLMGEVTGSVLGVGAAVISSVLDIPVWFVKQSIKSGSKTYEDIRRDWEQLNQSEGDSESISKENS